MAFPTELLPDGERHLDAYAGRGRDGHVFLGPQGGQLRRGDLRDDWNRTRKDAGGTADAHFHDLRHTGNTGVGSNPCRGVSGGAGRCYFAWSVPMRLRARSHS